MFSCSLAKFGRVGIKHHRTRADLYKEYREIVYAEPRIGEAIANRYRLERKLGEGGQAWVFAATDLSTGIVRAVKVVRATIGDNTGVRKRFAREIKLTQRFVSEHLVAVVDSGLVAGAPFMVMELLNGETLSERVRRQRALGPRAAVETLMAVATAMIEPHAANVVHRDLKPSNVFYATVRGVEVVKVLDFGIAKVAGLEASEPLTQTAEVLGTTHYMAPEQFLSPKDVDPRTDVWAMGILLYRCVVGRPPFVADSIFELARLVDAAPHPPVLGLHPACPPELAAIIDRCLEKAPRDRYANAAELARALQVVHRTVVEDFSDDAPTIALASEPDVVAEADIETERRASHSAPPTTKPDPIVAAPIREETAPAHDARAAWPAHRWGLSIAVVAGLATIVWSLNVEHSLGVPHSRSPQVSMPPAPTEPMQPHRGSTPSEAAVEVTKAIGHSPRATDSTTPAPEPSPTADAGSSPSHAARDSAVPPAPRRKKKTPSRYFDTEIHP